MFCPLGGVIKWHRAVECLVSVSNCVIHIIVEKNEAFLRVQFFFVYNLGGDTVQSLNPINYLEGNLQLHNANGISLHTTRRLTVII